MGYSANLLEYNSFLANEMIENAKMERYIKECVLMTEGKNNIKNMAILNESVSDKIKEAFKKIMEAIGRMWGKFLESITNLINANRSYLEKYKDIILKKKLNSEVTYKMYDYSVGLNRLLSTAAPMFNYETMKSYLDDDDKFITQYFKQVPKSESTFTDRCKTYFRGSSDPIDIAAAKINMTDVFNYCYNYESKMKPTLEKDLNEIKKAANNAADVVNTAEKEKNTQKPTTGTPQNTANNNQQSNQAQPKQESFLYGKYYSYVFEEYIEELEISYNNSGNNGGGENNPAKNVKNIDGEAPDKDAQNQAIRNDESEYDDKIKKIQNYLNVCGGLLAAKQTIAEEIFKEYMQIIKAHVRDHVGAPKNDKSDDKVADAGTNYKNVVDNAFKNPGKETEKSK